MVNRGLPVRDDGGIDLRVAKAWLRAHRSPSRRLRRALHEGPNPFDRRDPFTDGVGTAIEHIRRNFRHGYANLVGHYLDASLADRVWAVALTDWLLDYWYSGYSLEAPPAIDWSVAVGAKNAREAQKLFEHHQAELTRLIKQEQERQSREKGKHEIPQTPTTSPGGGGAGDAETHQDSIGDCARAK